MKAATPVLGSELGVLRKKIMKYPTKLIAAAIPTPRIVSFIRLDRLLS